MPFSVVARILESEQRVVVDFKDLSLQLWCLNLVLLNAGMISKLSVINRGEQDGFRLELKLVGDDHIDARARGVLDRDVLDLEISERELGYWLVYFLKYFRDGVADVDHIDVEILDRCAPGSLITLTFRIAKAIPPLSPEEARRRLEGSAG